MCVPLKSCGRFTYMLKRATVCCSPPLRSLTTMGCLMSLMPTLSMEICRLSLLFWISGISSTIFAGWSMVPVSGSNIVLHTCKFSAKESTCNGLKSPEFYDFTSLFPLHDIVGKIPQCVGLVVKTAQRVQGPCLQFAGGRFGACKSQQAGGGFVSFHVGTLGLAQGL